VNIDAEQFPLILVRWSGAVSEHELITFFREMDKLADRAAEARRHYAVVSQGEADFTPTQRKRLADWTAGFPEARAQWDLGNFVVLESAAARGVLTAVRWLSPKLSKVFVYPSLAQARAAAEERLAAANGR
jgi:hypothetical protein